MNILIYVTIYFIGILILAYLRGRFDDFDMHEDLLFFATILWPAALIFSIPIYLFVKTYKYLINTGRRQYYSRQDILAEQARARRAVQNMEMFEDSSGS